MAIYYATKAYVLSFSEALAAELEGQGVTISVLCPGPTATGFTARAGLEGTALSSSGLKVMTAAEVARAGYEGFREGKRIVIPGAMNKIGAQAIRFMPRSFATGIVKRMQEKRR
jgi:short-subunit dehydrogenase